MYNEVIVKKPRKVYQCELCLTPIEGEHVKIAQVHNGDFCSYRAHIECNKACHEMCNACDWQYDCQSGVTDCFLETYVNKEKS